MLKLNVSKSLFFLLTIEISFLKILDYSIIDSIKENENNIEDCISSINFPSEYINSEINDNEIILNLCIESSFLENGLFFYLAKSSNYEIPKRNSITNQPLLYDNDLNIVYLISSISYSYDKNSEKNILYCFTKKNFTFNGVEFSLLMKECNLFFEAKRGSIFYLKISIFDFPFPKNAFKYNIICHLNNYEGKKYISILSYSFKKIFEKNDISIISENENQCGILTNYILTINTKNLFFDNYDNVLINIILPYEKFKNDNSLIDYYRSSKSDYVKIFDEGKRNLTLISDKEILCQLYYESSNFIQLKIDNIWSPYYNNTLNGLKIILSLPSKDNNNNNNILLGITSNSELKVKNDNFNFLNDYYLKCNAFGNLNSKFEISSQLINTFTDVKLSLKTLSYYPNNLFIEIHFPLEISITEQTVLTCENFENLEYNMINQSSFNITNLLYNNENKDKVFNFYFKKLKLPDKAGEDNMIIKFYFINENNNLIPVYYNNENVFEIILFSNLNVKIELQSYIDFQRGKINIIPGRKIKENYYFLISIPKGGKFYLTENICCKQNNNKLYSFYEIRNKNDIIKVSNLEPSNEEENIEIYIEYIKDKEYIKKADIFNLIELYNDKNELISYCDSQHYFFPRFKNANLFEATISTQNCFESSLYTFKSEFNSKIDVNGIL